MYFLQAGFLEGHPRPGVVHDVRLLGVHPHASASGSMGMAPVRREPTGHRSCPRVEPAGRRGPDHGCPSVLIPTFNEAGQHRRGAMASAELGRGDPGGGLVLDGQRTVELAKRSAPGVRVLEHEYVNSATQKNWSLPQTCPHAGPWCWTPTSASPRTARPGGPVRCWPRGARVRAAFVDPAG